MFISCVCDDNLCFKTSYILLPLLSKLYANMYYTCNVIMHSHYKQHHFWLEIKNVYYNLHLFFKVVLHPPKAVNFKYNMLFSTVSKFTKIFPNALMWNYKLSSYLKYLFWLSEISREAYPNHRLISPTFGRNVNVEIGISFHHIATKRCHES